MLTTVLHSYKQAEESWSQVWRVHNFSVWAVLVTGLFGLGRLETFRSDYEILQKSCMCTF